MGHGTQRRGRGFVFFVFPRTVSDTNFPLDQSIQIYPSFIGYVAKGIALVGQGEKLKGYRACDVAFERIHSTRVTFLLLIKVGTPSTANMVAFS